MKYLKAHTDHVTLSVYVQPNASKSKVVGKHDEKLKIALDAPPVDGAANAALLNFLATLLNCSKKQIQLVRGEKNRSKVVSIHGQTMDQIVAAIQSGAKI